MYTSKRQLHSELPRFSFKFPRFRIHYLGRLKILDSQDECQAILVVEWIDTRCVKKKVERDSAARRWCGTSRCAFGESERERKVHRARTGERRTVRRVLEVTLITIDWRLLDKQQTPAKFSYIWPLASNVWIAIKQRIERGSSTR